MTNRQTKVKMREKTGFYKMREGERETEVKCGRITRDAGDLAGLVTLLLLYNIIIKMHDFTAERMVIKQVHDLLIP